MYLFAFGIKIVIPASHFVGSRYAGKAACLPAGRESRETYLDCPDKPGNDIGKVIMVAQLELNKERLSKYKSLAVAFSYPEGSFFDLFPELSEEREGLVREYDRLFRVKEVWLYGTEYISEHEFQRSNYLADISGFYKAFGVEIHNDRPDSLEALLEFMHYLIYKEINAPSAEKAGICIDAQKKFLNEYAGPMAKAIADKVIAQAQVSFYKTISLEMLEFLAEEEKILKK